MNENRYTRYRTTEQVKINPEGFSFTSFLYFSAFLAFRQMTLQNNSEASGLDIFSFDHTGRATT